MKVELRANTRIFISTEYRGERFWLVDIQNDRNSQGRLYLRGTWNVDAQQARTFTHQYGHIIRERLLHESNCPTQISLECGDKAAFLEE